MGDPRVKRTRFRRLVAICIVVIALVRFGPTVVMDFELQRASRIEVSFIVGNEPGNRYETVELSGSELAAFCAQMRKDTSPLYLQVRSVISNIRVQAFDQRGAVIASIGIYAAGEKSESILLLRELARKGMPVEKRHSSDSTWKIHMMRQAR